MVTSQSCELKTCWEPRELHSSSIGLVVGGEGGEHGNRPVPTLYMYSHHMGVEYIDAEMSSFMGVTHLAGQHWPKGRFMIYTSDLN